MWGRFSVSGGALYGCGASDTGCSDPLYRRASRVSMGTVFQVPWTYIPKGDWAENSMETLKKLGFRTAAMALSDRSVSIADPRFRRKKN